MDNSVNSKHRLMKGAQPNILGQFEPLPSPEGLLAQQLEEWGGQISLWDSDPGQREFIVSVVDRSRPLWYKLSLHCDSSCVINGVYYSELEHGLSAIAGRHGIQRVGDKRPTLECPDRKPKKSPLKIWRRLSIGTILKTDSADRQTSPQKSPKQVRRSSSLRLFHGKVTRKFSLKNADQDPVFRPANQDSVFRPANQDSVFRPAESEDSLAVSHPIISGPVRQFLMPSPVEAPFSHATLPRQSKGTGAVSSSAGNLPQNTDLDSAIGSEKAREKKRPRRQSEPLEFIQHRKLTRSQSMVKAPRDSPPRLSKYSRSNGRLETRSTEQLAPSRSGAHAYTSPQGGVTWRMSKRTDEIRCFTQTLTCPGDRPNPFVLDSRSAARFSVFPIESALLKSGSVQSSRRGGGRMPGEEAEAPKQIRSVFSISV